MTESHLPFSYFACIWMLGFAFIIGANMVRRFRRVRKLNQVLIRIAEHFAGRFEPASLLKPGEVLFSCRNAVAVLGYTHIHKEHYESHVTVPWPDRDLKCDLTAREIHSWTANGKPRFPAMAGGKCKKPVDSAFVRGLLTSDIQHLVGKLGWLKEGKLYLSSNKDVRLEWSEGFFRIIKERYLTSFNDLEIFVVLSSAIIDAALVARKESIGRVGLTN